MALDSNLSTVWMARNTFDSLLFGDTVSFDPEYRIFGSEFQQFTRRGMGEFQFELNGVPQRIEIMKVIPLNPNVTAEFWILNDPDNPLIIMMDLGWRIELKEINHT
jgi:hypothetical protein